MQSIEEDLQVTLFERSGPKLTLTDAGRSLVSEVRQMSEAANAVSLKALGQNQAVEGLVRISVADVLANAVLPEFLMQLQDSAPRLKIEILAPNELSDLLHREADIAIRHVRPDEPELIAKLIREEPAHLYGFEGYFRRRGRPQTLGDLKNHDFISFGDEAEMIGHLNPLGFDLTSKNFRVGSKSGTTAWHMACQGSGLCVMSETVANASKDAIRVFPDMDPMVIPTWLVTHRELRTSQKIRTVYDALAEHLTRR